MRCGDVADECGDRHRPATSSAGTCKKQRDGAAAHHGHDRWPPMTLRGVAATLLGMTKTMKTVEPTATTMAARSSASSISSMTTSASVRQVRSGTGTARVLPLRLAVHTGPPSRRPKSPGSGRLEIHRNTSVSNCYAQVPPGVTGCRNGSACEFTPRAIAGASWSQFRIRPKAAAEDPNHTEHKSAAARFQN